MDLSVRTETFGGDNLSWLGSEHGTSNARTVTILKSTLTAGTHYPQGYVRSGTPLGKITAAGANLGKFGAYDPAATDGRQTFAGFLLTPQSVTAGPEIVAPLFEHGAVIEANLPIAIDAAARTAVAGRIWFR